MRCVLVYDAELSLSSDAGRPRIRDSVSLTDCRAIAFRSAMAGRQICVRRLHDHALAFSSWRDRRSISRLDRRLHVGEPRRIARNGSRNRHREHSVVNNDDELWSHHSRTPTNSELPDTITRRSSGAPNRRLIRRRQVRLGRQHAARRLRLLRVHEIRVREIRGRAAANGARAGAHGNRRGARLSRIAAW